jgi:hypothetical protein
MLRNPLYIGVVRVDKWGVETTGDFKPPAAGHVVVLKDATVPAGA